MSDLTQEEFQQEFAFDFERQMIEDIEALRRDHPEVPYEVLKLAWLDGARWGYPRGIAETAKFIESQAAIQRRRAEMGVQAKAGVQAKEGSA